MLADLRSAHTKKWAEVLASSGINVHVFGLTPATETFRGVTIHEGSVSSTTSSGEEGSVGKLTYIHELGSLKRLIKSLKPDILHAHYATSYGLIGALSGFSPFAVSVWGSDVVSFPKKSPAHRAMVKFVLNRADVLFSTSEFMAGVASGLASKRFVITPFGVEISSEWRVVSGEVSSEISSELRVASSEAPVIKIGCVKTVSEVYGQDILIRAFAGVVKEMEGVGISLELVGGGPEIEKFATLAEELGVGNRVKFAGYVPNDQIMDVHRGFDIEVYPTRVEESFGVSVVEAMSCGVPCIVSKTGGLQDLVEDGVSGFHVPVGDVDAIKSKLIKLIRDPALRKSVGEAAKKRVADRYDLKKNAAVMIAEYKKLLINKNKF
ncbi:MAG: glycosyltransferase family 4 protein [Chlorobiota bacterium]|nr:MAG: glycosyltransferase family 4 protein [Chlorobiota bacterium]